MLTERLTDGQTGMTNPIVTFCSFANLPENGSFVTGGEGVECLLWLRKAFESSECGNEPEFHKMLGIPALTENATASGE
jgi:hypothetical protein